MLLELEPEHLCEDDSALLAMAQPDRLLHGQDLSLFAPATAKLSQPTLQSGSSTDCLREIAALWGLELPGELGEASQAQDDSSPQILPSGAAELALPEGILQQQQRFAPEQADLGDLDELAALWGLRDVVRSLESTAEDPAIAALKQTSTSEQGKSRSEPDGAGALHASSGKSGGAACHPETGETVLLDQPQPRGSEQGSFKCGCLLKSAPGIALPEPAAQAQPQVSSPPPAQGDACTAAACPVAGRDHQNNVHAVSAEQGAAGSGGAPAPSSRADDPCEHAQDSQQVAAQGQAAAGSITAAREGDTVPKPWATGADSHMADQAASMDSLFDTLSAELLQDLVGLSTPAAAEAASQPQAADPQEASSPATGHNPASADQDSAAGASQDSGPAQSAHGNSAAHGSQNSQMSGQLPQQRQQQQQQPGDRLAARPDQSAPEQDQRQTLSIRVDSALHLQLPSHLR